MGMSDAELAIEAALTGARIVRDRFGTELSRVDKGGGDFATAADLESERAIVELLRAERPDDAVIGEEGGRRGPEDTDRRWLLDPLCGTRNYAAGTRLVAVNVALRAGDATTAAASADPFAEELYWTDGTGAWVRQGGADKPLSPLAESRLVELDVHPPFANTSWFRAADLLVNPGFTDRFDPRVTSTTLALLWVATGQRAGYIADRDLREDVHFTAGIAVCQAAGCVVTNLRGEPVNTGVGGLIAAADRTTHAALLDLI
ncbi:inositol monophosphatase family protein [Pseudonocardiaceae bacterium YIM PH 21723]|nr:inositol monophosphatase family protein [Pseudonocardiaceae bacterium YIM PH 21723]